MSNQNPKKIVKEQTEWDNVIQELESENLKLASYDNTLVPLLGDISGKTILDYGAGPGILALALKKLGGDVKVFDINLEIQEKAAEKIGDENIYKKFEDISKEHFDLVIANLVLCIVSESEVKKIVMNLKIGRASCRERV